MSLPVKKITDYIFEIPASGKMHVPARIYATESMLQNIFQDNALEQVKNVACLPGIAGYSFAMPDIHWGYGFPIGGVAAFNMETGVISPGGVGYDINCGVRLIKTNLVRQDIKQIDALMTALYKRIPSGVGSTGPIKLNKNEEKQMLQKGAGWAVENGYGNESDLDKIEENGCMRDANPSLVSDRALERGKNQIGTLGSGNHFVEVGVVSEIFDQKAAEVLDLQKDKITLIIHTGSRGFGHQVCDDYIKVMLKAAQKYGIDLPDKQLCCAPIRSSEGKNYLAAMACAVNFAFCNRQMISYWAGEAFKSVFGNSVQLDPVYEVAHNIAKIENHMVGDVSVPVCVHRKGATRAFGPNHPDIPRTCQQIGQPVLIPGDMGRYSYVLTGTETAMQQTFGSTCHGAGRVLSRKKAKKAAHGRNLFQELKNRGIQVRASSRATVSEEISEAYKDVSQVVDAVSGAGLSSKVAKLKPIGVIKG